MDLKAEKYKNQNKKNSLNGVKSRINMTEERTAESEDRRIEITQSGHREKIDWKYTHCLPLPLILPSAKSLFCLHIAISHITHLTFSNVAP